LAGLKPLESRLRASRTNLELRIKARRDGLSFGLLERALGGRVGRVKEIVVRPAEGGSEDDVSLMLTRVSAAETADIVRRLRTLDGVIEIAEGG